MTDGPPAGGKVKGEPRCPICKKPAVSGYKPFCSKRCADIDLGKWFTNAYAIPGAEHDDETESPGNAAPGEGDDGDHN